ncbi:MAG: gamma carbonic anhydrase family protein [Chitinispirillaceae bacterium]|nr:gamma carbonic anhydrase family protein [Chitinispirillaceae bacterium]
MLFTFDSRTPHAGRDTYVSETAQIIGDVTIGDNCYIGHGAILRGDYGRITIGAGTAVEEAVVIHAPPDESAEIGERVTVGHGAILHGKRIGRGAVIGMGAILSLRSEIGEGAIVGEGSVVTMKQVIPPRVVALGNPAKTVREVSANDAAFWERAKQLYIDLAKKYLDRGMQPVTGDRVRGTEW